MEKTDVWKLETKKKILNLKDMAEEILRHISNLIPSFATTLNSTVITQMHKTLKVGNIVQIAMVTPENQSFIVVHVSQEREASYVKNQTLVFQMV